MGKEGSNTVVHECQHKCTSKSHASNLTAALTKDCLSDEKLAAYLKWCCVRYPRAVDLEGRTLLHMAASKGRVKLLSFLLKHKDVNVNDKDKESQFTALHRSLFYGQIHCAVRLIQSGANIEQLDSDDLTPLDHVIKYRPEMNECSGGNIHEVYVWGTNTNYTLGIGHHQSRANPEPLYMFKRKKIDIKQVVMSKYHSAFVSSDGRLWTCGHGQGGRLGFEDEATILTPKCVEVASSAICIFVALGTDHTLLLMANKSVWSFGLNTYHQLGHEPPPDKVLTPKVIKALRCANIIGISASKYHSVFWSEKQLYTCGLNGGQLGHPKESGTTVPVPKAVTCLTLKKCTIKFVTSSVGATVLKTSDGHIYVFDGYGCRRITLRPNLCKIVRAIGGHLDHKINMECLQEKGGDELQILMITSYNSVRLWKKGNFEWDLCVYRNIQITDLALNKNCFLIISSDGKAFRGEIENSKRMSIQKKTPCNLSKDYVKLIRIPHIHRAVRVTSDLKGRNFAITQCNPKSKLIQFSQLPQTKLEDHMTVLYNALECNDYYQDVIFEVEGRRFSAHRYIVASSSPVLEEMMKKGIESDGICTVKLQNIRFEVFSAILRYMYTKDIDTLIFDLFPSSDESDTEVDITDKLDAELISAFEYNKRKRDSLMKNTSRAKSKTDPLALLTNATTRFEMWELQNEFLEIEEGIFLHAKGHIHSSVPLKFDRHNFQYLYDVTLKSEDGIEIKAHKCILVSRLEYFNCMINRGWLESTQKSAINLPIPGKVLQILIDYLYTDEALILSKTEDSDLAFMTLVVADQFFCNGLKRISECSLANLMSLENAAETLQIAVTYNANELKNYALEFICNNLTALLEARSLEILSDSVLEELSHFYRLRVPWMCMRHITAYYNAPDEELVDMISKTEPVSLEIIEEISPAKSGSKGSKKKPREKRKSESERVRNMSTNSFTSDEEIEPLLVEPMFDSRDVVDTEEEAWVKVVNRPTKHQKNTQQKVRAPVEVSKILLGSLQEDNFVSLNLVPLKEPIPAKGVVRNLEKEFQSLSISSNKDFPALDASPSERNANSHSQTPRQNQVVLEKFVKLSQKQKKKLATQSSSENEESVKKTEITVKSPWGTVKNEPQLLADIMKQEIKASTSQNSSFATSPPWQSTAEHGLSLSAVMASERRERELIARMKSKPLVYIQMEDKAIEDLLLLYNANNVTDERITVRRAEYEFVSRPVWVCNRK